MGQKNQTYEISNHRWPEFVGNWWYNDSRSDHFVLDGHHKLIAYRNLGKFPAVVEITHLPQSTADLEFDLEQLSEVLFPWQFEHIKQHCA
jgi:hypothetical protein